MEESEVAEALIAYTRLADVVGEAEHDEIAGPFVFIFSNQQDMERFLIEIVDHRRCIIFCLLPLQPEEVETETLKGVLSDGTSRITCRGKQIYQLFALGTFSEYTVVSDVALTKIREDAPLDKVCLLGCGISTGYGAAINTAKVEPGSTCAVFGLGGVGLAAVMGCKAAGASRIFAVGHNKDKFQKAKLFGATDFVNPKDHDKPVSQVLVDLTNGGVDFALECVGNVEVMRCLCDAFLSFRLEDCGDRLVDDYMNKKLMVDEFVTHNLPLEKINEAFDLMTSGKR
ncbi:hypothetical protein SKAU_G00396180 [Synaphobranchus kaupii]|uniref:Alcohol dehydrogenase-like C-terminal domain-containing protein n=1 Tax=Synaphobranchus kaupii TaxID=118154 RepID=A0A9Q1ECK2_SYNKA|nr:hypothetical protein SKAU_G00396180 [Synaphobranchus kaupii]